MSALMTSKGTIRICLILALVSLCACSHRASEPMQALQRKQTESFSYVDKTYLLPRTLVRSRAYEAAVEEYALYAWRPLPAKDALYYAVALLKTGRRDEAARVLEMTEMPDDEAGDTGGVQGVTSKDVEAACDGLLAYADSLPEDVFVDELGESRGRHWTGVLTIPLEVLLRIAFAVL